MDLKTQAGSKITHILKLLSEHRYESNNISEKPFNFEITVTKNDCSYKVLVYFGKKGIKTVVQGNTENPLYREITNIISDEPELNLTKNNTSVSEPPDYIGSDESGKGDIFGPLVICSFHTDDKVSERLREIGVKDSKQLSDAQISNLSREMKAEFKHRYDIVSISPEKYNELYTKIRNLNGILDWAHSKAIDNLLKRVGSKKVIIDKFTPKKLNYVNRIIDSKTELILTSKAERFTGVAAASILARDSFNSWFEREDSKKFGLRKGASEPALSAAEKLFKLHGEEILSQKAKLHFKSMQRILNPDLLLKKKY
jgi:ribonuclease HIII